MKEILWKWRFTRLVNKWYISKTGKTKNWEYVERTTLPWISEAAATLLEDVENSCFILIEQYRVPIEKNELWLIAGISDEDIPTIETIAKEVREEAGRIAIDSKFLETVPSSWGLTSEETDIYHTICDGNFLWQQLWEDEDIKIHQVDTDKIDEYLIHAANDLELRVWAKLGTALRYIRAGKWIPTNR